MVGATGRWSVAPTIGFRVDYQGASVVLAAGIALQDKGYGDRGGRAQEGAST
ncbi:hypothetical protein MAHJHV33_48580 [Mycobacterium avium subsp. hominissuis]